MAEAHIKSSSVASSDVKNRFGTFLRQTREKAGLSIEAVAQETKISKQFIIYLETGSVESLPGQVFGRGFIKNIARYLRSDTVEMLRLYDACWGVAENSPKSEQPAAMVSQNVPSAQQPPEPLSVNRAPRVEKQSVVARVAASSIPDIPHLPSVTKDRRRQSLALPAWLVRSVMSPHVRLSILGGIAAIMVIGVFGRWVGANMKRSAVSPKVVSSSQVIARKAADAPVDAASGAQVMNSDVAVTSDDQVPSNVVEKSIAAPVAGKITQSVTDAQTLKSIGAVAVEEESPLKVQQGSPVAFDQVLELNVSSPIEIKMTVDGKKMEKTSFSADQHRFTFHERAELMISDASALEIIYNGKSLGVLGNKGRKRRIFFQAKPSESDFSN